MTLDLHEDETNEFKERWTNEALEDVAAFANHKGGTLLVGVRDDGEIVGFEGGDVELQRIVNQIVDLLGLNPQVEQREYEDRPVLVIQVSPASRPVSYRGRYLTRVGSTSRDMTPDEIAQRLMVQLGQTWDSLVAEVDLETVGQETVQRFVHLSRKRLPHLSVDEPSQRVLENLNLLRDSGLTHAGVLLFGQAPQRLFPMAQVHIGRFKGESIIDDHTMTGTLWDQLDGVMERFRTYLQVQLEVDPEEASVEGLQRREIWEYPLEALREAALNALIHRDYTASGEVQVRVYDDRLEVWNPGGLPEGLTLEDLRREGHPSRLRNPLLAQAFYFAGLIERWGTGTTRMIKACQDQGLPEPEFSEEAGGFKVIFYKDSYTSDRLQEMGLHERQVQAVLYVREKGSISNKKYQELTGASKPTVTRDLEDLIKRDIFVKKGTTGRGTRYQLKGSKGS